MDKSENLEVSKVNDINNHVALIKNSLLEIKKCH